jgi:hypothetical protein
MSRLSVVHWLQAVQRRFRGAPRKRPSSAGLRPARFVPRLEQLETRTLPSTYVAFTAPDLIADINAANLNGGANTIVLAGHSNFTLTAVNNTADGPTGLPVIADQDRLTIIGSNNTIERSTAAGTPDFRLFDVAVGGSLTLLNLTLQNGVASGPGDNPFTSSQGGAIVNQGTLALSGVTLEGNAARFGAGPAYGGALANGPQGYGTATLVRCLVSGNSADGGGGGIANGGTLLLDQSTVSGNSAGSGGGGGIVNAGTLTVKRSTVSDNSTDFGFGGGGILNYFGTVTVSESTLSGNSASAFGGAISAFGGTVTVTGSTLSGNNAPFGGGAIDNNFGTVNVGTSTFFANSPDNIEGGFNDLGGNTGLP